YAAAGRFFASVFVKDANGAFNRSKTFAHVVHYPIADKPPATSAPIVYDKARNRVYSVNQDNDSIASIDPMALKKVGELPVYQHPEAIALAPDGKLWVLHSDDYAVAIVDPDKFTIERGFRLPYVSQPIGLAMSPTGDAAYVTLMATGKLLKLDPRTGQTLGELDVGPKPRGVAVSSDGKSVYVTRFISPEEAGEVVEVDGTSFNATKRLPLMLDTTTDDTDQKGRGLPNYLFSVVLTPDGRQAWVPAKKDDIVRGKFRENNPLNQDNIVRPMMSILDRATGSELVDSRIDFDDRALSSHVEFSPLGDLAFVTLTGSNRIDVRKTYTGELITGLLSAGLAPRGTALGPDGRLFVQGSLSRDVVVFDVAPVLDGSDPRSIELARISTVAKEKFSTEVLLGKQIFYNAEDKRMSTQGYLSCAVCHFDGFEDGRVWDFTDRGEGLRNTTSLLGRRGMGMGRVHWSGNFDEIQDFENEIRALFNGSGFLTNEVFNSGTVKDPLGQPKKGLDKNLDALAAFVSALDHVNPSPYRNRDGTMTADALQGRNLFGRLGCDFCHEGNDLTDSERSMLHDVGTLKPGSGGRSGGPLTGIDTPTLLGVWETAPYLHDGTAATLRDVLTTDNPNDEHAFASSLTSEQIDQLVSYMRQLDNGLPASRLPFEPNPLADAGSDADIPLGIVPGAGAMKGRCTCSLPGRGGPDRGFALWAALPLLAWAWRRRNSNRSAKAERGDR
ncbi:MAG TPA: hypothetical protein VJT73_07055, partial [Polyangiaceae bacterium]|nr:hypothetical protein [Polyangiaceae bacterium]